MSDGLVETEAFLRTFAAREGGWWNPLPDEVALLLAEYDRRGEEIKRLRAGAVSGDEVALGLLDANEGFTEAQVRFALALGLPAPFSTDQIKAEIDRLRAQLAAQEPVVEAATALAEAQRYRKALTELLGLVLKHVTDPDTRFLLMGAVNNATLALHRWSPEEPGDE